MTRSESISRLGLFFALSRTPHGLLDMTTPFMAATLAMGALPPFRVALLGALTAFAAYTAVYALNDVIDHKIDRIKMEKGGIDPATNYIDAVHVRHPIAQGLLPLSHGALWTAAWSLVALAGALTLNPVCVAIFLGAVALETVYCLMIRISHLRVLVSGVVKTAGPMAAVFAVDPSPSPVFLAGLFLWLFFWEIGGQNVPADWYDMEEDKRFDARTVPVRYGPRGASVIAFASLCLAAVLGLYTFAVLSPGGYGLVPALLFLAANVYLLLIPGYRLYAKLERHQAMVLFNKASFYPLTIFVLALFGLVL